MNEQIKTFFEKIVAEPSDLGQSSLMDAKSMAKEALDGRYDCSNALFALRAALYHQSILNFNNEKILEMLREGKIQELIGEFERAKLCLELAREAELIFNSR